jgi:hypothetical protein
VFIREIPSLTAKTDTKTKPISEALLISPNWDYLLSGPDAFESREIYETYMNFDQSTGSKSSKFTSESLQITDFSALLVTNSRLSSLIYPLQSLPSTRDMGGPVFL